MVRLEHIQNFIIAGNMNARNVTFGDLISNSKGRFCFSE